MRRVGRLRSILAAMAVALLAGCVSDSPDGAPGPESSPDSPATTSGRPAAEPSAGTPTGTPTGASTGPSAGPSVGPSAGPSARPPRADPDRVRAGTAMAAVRHLAGIGPRPGTSPAYRRAADWVERQLERYGWQVRRQTFPTPAGVSWGIPVRGGPSVNLVATRGDVRPDRRWLVVGAHLDTVPQSPGAEDNASGVGVLLAVAEALAGRRTRLPVVLVAFGSEEPRGETDADHHYGSRAYVARLPAGRRERLAGMISLDRVGVGAALPVCGASTRPGPVLRQVRTAAREAGVPIVCEEPDRSSDHWSFVRAGLPGVRLGSTPYAGYHSSGDTPAAVRPAQLRRAGRVTVAWVR